MLLPRRRAPAGQRRGSSPTASRRWTPTTPSTWRSRRPTRSSRSATDNTIRDIPPRATPAPRPDPAGASGCSRDPGGLRDRPAQDPDFEATDDCTVVLRYLPDVPIWVVAGDERNMKVTEPIDVYIADKLFQLTAQRPARDAHATRTYREALDGQDDGRLRRQLRHRRRHRRARRDVRRQRRSTFSRSTHQTHVERREDIARRGRRGARRAPAGSTTSSTPRACCRAATSSRPRRRRSTPPPRSTTSRRS